MNNDELLFGVTVTNCTSCAEPHVAIHMIVNDQHFIMRPETARDIADQIYQGVLAAESGPSIN